MRHAAQSPVGKTEVTLERAGDVHVRTIEPRNSLYSRKECAELAGLGLSATIRNAFEFLSPLIPVLEETYTQGLGLSTPVERICSYSLQATTSPGSSRSATSSALSRMPTRAAKTDRSELAAWISAKRRSSSPT